MYFPTAFVNVDISDKELLESRNNVFVEDCMPILLKKGFEKSPFSSDWFGRNDHKDFNYNFTRIKNSFLQTIEVQITRGDKWIKFFLNIFDITPRLKSLHELDGRDGIKFKIPPNSLTEMHLVTESFDGIPLFNYRFMFKDHKLKKHFTKSGFEKKLTQLTKIIKEDLENLEYFIDFWHRSHKPLQTDIDGELIGLENMTVNERLNHIGFTGEFEKSLKDKAMFYDMTYLLAIFVANH